MKKVIILICCIIALLTGCTGKAPLTNQAYITDLSGEWKVTASGPASILNFLGDRKRVAGRSGYNIIGGKRWGYFSVEIDGRELILNYKDPRNPALLREVRDRIHRDGPGWAGTFYLSGKRVFDFRLDR